MLDGGDRACLVARSAGCAAPGLWGGLGLAPCFLSGNEDWRPGEVGKEDELPEMPLSTLFCLSG